MLEFQYRFLMVLLAFGAIATALLLATGSSEAAPIPVQHRIAMAVFTCESAALWLALRGRKHWFRPVAWIAQAASLVELGSAMLYVPGDELRILWLFANVPAVYLLLGKTVGGAIAALYIVALVAGNQWMASPYSATALATAVVAMAYSAAFFHAYNNQMLSLYRRLREMAMLDPLTGVMNGRAFHAASDAALHLACRTTRAYSVLFIDLDHFKSINDQWGHDAGDSVLKSVASCLKSNLRRSDLLGRIGGEEFCVFLPDTAHDAAAGLAENLRKAIESLFPWIGNQQIRVTASIGVADNRSAGTSLREIQRAADQAMYEAKAAGRNRVTVFADSQAAAGRT